MGRTVTAGYRSLSVGLPADSGWNVGTEQRIREVVASGETPIVSDIVVGVPIGTAEKTSTFWDDIKYIMQEEFRCTYGRCGGFPVEPDEKMVRTVYAIRERLASPSASWMMAAPVSGTQCRG